MRTLGAAPETLEFGSYRGALPPVVWPASTGTRILKRKKWLYAAIDCEGAWLSVALLRTGYATNVLAYVFDKKERRMLVDRTVVAPAFAASVTDDVHASGVVAKYGFGKDSVVFERSGPDLALSMRFARIELDVAFDETAGPPGIVAIADLGQGLRSATEKRALASIRGRFAVGGLSYDLTNAVGAWDYSNGLVPRHTTWRWAMGLGPGVAFNLVEGFIGEGECALFHAGDVHPLAEPRFTFDKANPETAWRIEGEGIDLRFEVGAVHAQHTNFGIVRSAFLQPVGAFYGTIGGVKVDGLSGVVEDQDVVW